MIEAITRLLAAWRLRRWNAIWRRLAQARVSEARRRDEALAYEHAHAEERVILARELLLRAAKFVRTTEGRWACSTFGSWRLAGRLDVDADGRLWRRSERHSFGWSPDMVMDTPESLASRVKTDDLRQSLHRLEPERFWRLALQEEVAHDLGFRGRPT